MSEKLAPIKDRISSWEEYQAYKDKVQGPNFTITLSREFGCQAFELAEVLKRELDKTSPKPWTIFDDKLIETIHERHQISTEKLKNVGLGLKLFDGVMAKLLGHWDTDRELYKIIVETIFSIAQDGNAIIVGRGSSRIAQGLPNCYHFRLVAPFDYRVERYMDRNQISLDEAIRIVQERSQMRENFIKNFLLQEFSLYNFNGIFDCSKASIPRIAGCILQYLGFPPKEELS